MTASCRHTKPEEPPNQAVTILSRTEVAHQFAVRKAHELIDRDEQLTGDASDGCGESPDGSDE